MEAIVCQACGMPLNDGYNAPDNPKYCKYCWADGQYIGAATIEEMVEVCVPHIYSMEPDAAREMLREQIPKLEHWRVS